MGYSFQHTSRPELNGILIEADTRPTGFLILWTTYPVLGLAQSLVWT